MSKVGLCLSDVELNDYLNGALADARKTGLEKHLADCDVCLRKLAFAYRTVGEFRRERKKGVKRMKSNWKNSLWLFACIITFALSFLVPRYFVQLLIATILLGAKWIFDSVNARILIMIYDAWKKGGQEESSKILQNLDDRFPR